MSYLNGLNPYMTPSAYADELRRRQAMLRQQAPQAEQMSPNPPSGQAPQMSPNREPTREEKIASMIRRANVDNTAAENELKRQSAYAAKLSNTASAGPRQLGNVVVNNPWEGLEVGFNRALGGYLSGKARQKDEALQERRDEKAEAAAELATLKLTNELDQQDIQNNIAIRELLEGEADKGYQQDKDMTTWEKEARRDFVKESKTFIETDEAFGKILAASDPEKQSPQTQMSLIFGYMKMLDPGSTVREGEFATAEQTTGIPGRVVNAYNRALEGEFLDAKQVAGFASAAGDIYQNALRSFDANVGYYTGLAEDQGADVGHVVRDYALNRSYFDGENNDPPGGGENNDPPKPDSKLIKPPGTSQELWDRMDDEQKRQVMEAAGMVP